MQKRFSFAAKAGFGVLVVLATLGAAPQVAEAQDWKTIVQLQLGYGYTQTMYTPNAVQTTVKGDRFRMVVPHACGATQFYQIALYGQSYSGQQILLAAQAISAEQDLAAGVNRFTYVVNGGVPATVREIGLYAYVPQFTGCKVTFQQQNTVDDPASESCDLSYACPQVADGARYCTATPKDGSAGIFAQWGNPAGDNQCNVQRGVKGQICAQGLDPDDYTLQCVFERE